MCFLQKSNQDKRNRQSSQSTRLLNRYVVYRALSFPPLISSYLVDANDVDLNYRNNGDYPTRSGSFSVLELISSSPYIFCDRIFSFLMNRLALDTNSLFLRVYHIKHENDLLDMRGSSSSFLLIEKNLIFLFYICRFAVVACLGIVDGA